MAWFGLAQHSSGEALPQQLGHPLKVAWLMLKGPGAVVTGLADIWVKGQRADLSPTSSFYLFIHFLNLNINVYGCTLSSQNSH